MVRLVTTAGTPQPLKTGKHLPRYGRDIQVSELPCQNANNRPLFDSDNPDEQYRAAALCFDCPIMGECAALGQDEAYGVWGGTTPADRPLAEVAERRRLREIDAADRRLMEARVDALMSDGSTSVQTAEALGISTASVQRYRAAHTKRLQRAAA